MVTHPSMQAPPALKRLDPEVASAIEKEMKRQVESVLLIASESYASRPVLEAAGSVMTNKYAEGYPGARYYGGCEFVDIVESLAIDRAKRLFGAEHANVQPHSGTQANMAVYFSMLKPGDTIMGMKLDHGGHLSHGSPVNFTGKMYKIVGYGVDRETQRIDFEEVERLAKENRPKIIVAGYSTYPRTVDWARFRAIADEVGATLMVDMAHIAGLVAGGAHPSPVPHAQIVTSTTHKSLRGPRAAFILTKKEFQQSIDKTVFPQVQSGPFMHIVAAKAVCFGEALEPGFKKYAAQVVENAKTIAKTLMDNKFKLVSGGTDNHLMLVDLSPMNMSGKEAEEALGRANIHLNRNAIPYDPKPARVTSGIRIGTPSVTSRGMGQKEMVMIGEAIVKVLTHLGNAEVEAEVRRDMIKMATTFPVPGITSDRGWPG